MNATKICKSNVYAFTSKRNGGLGSIVSLLSQDQFNPIALRKAKIVYSFGLSECKMVKCSAVTLITDSSFKSSHHFK